MREYAILKTIEHFERLLEEETGEERKARLQELIQREYEKLHAEADSDAAKPGNSEAYRSTTKNPRQD